MRACRAFRIYIYMYTRWCPARPHRRLWPSRDLEVFHAWKIFFRMLPSDEQDIILLTIFAIVESIIKFPKWVLIKQLSLATLINFSWNAIKQRYFIYLNFINFASLFCHWYIYSCYEILEPLLARNIFLNIGYIFIRDVVSIILNIRRKVFNYDLLANKNHTAFQG